MLKKLSQYQNFHSVDLQEEELNDIFNKIKASRKIETSVNNLEGSQCLDWNLQEDYNPELGKSTRVRCLNEFLKESQLDTSSSICDTREDDGTVNFSNQTLSLLQSSEKDKELKINIFHKLYCESGHISKHLLCFPTTSSRI